MKTSLKNCWKKRKLFIFLLLLNKYSTIGMYIFFNFRKNWTKARFFSTSTTHSHNSTRSTKWKTDNPTRHLQHKSITNRFIKDVRRMSTHTRSVRLHKFLAESGIVSRRKAERLIAEGRVQVNGTHTRKGTRLAFLKPGDEVRVMGRTLKFNPTSSTLSQKQQQSKKARPRVWLANKLKGELVTTSA